MALVLIAGTARAVPLETRFEFSSGFDASLNGGAVAPTGPLTFTVVVDTTTPDTYPTSSTSRGQFAIMSLALSAPSLGLIDQAVIAPDPLFLHLYMLGGGLLGGMSILTNSTSVDIGFSDSPPPAGFPSDVNDLTTIPLQTVLSAPSSYYFGTLTLQNGDTLGANIGTGGPAQFSARLIPEPGSLGLVAAGLAVLGFARRRT